MLSIFFYRFVVFILLLGLQFYKKIDFNNIQYSQFLYNYFLPSIFKFQN